MVVEQFESGFTVARSNPNKAIRHCLKGHAIRRGYPLWTRLKMANVPDGETAIIHCDTCGQCVKDTAWTCKECQFDMCTECYSSRLESSVLLAWARLQQSGEAEPPLAAESRQCIPVSNPETPISRSLPDTTPVAPISSEQQTTTPTAPISDVPITSRQPESSLVAPILEDLKNELGTISEEFNSAAQRSSRRNLSSPKPGRLTSKKEKKRKSAPRRISAPRRCPCEDPLLCDCQSGSRGTTSSATTVHAATQRQDYPIILETSTSRDSFALRQLPDNQHDRFCPNGHQICTGYPLNSRLEMIHGRYAGNLEIHCKTCSRVITGTSWACKDCDFDMCTECYASSTPTSDLLTNRPNILPLDEMSMLSASVVSNRHEAKRREAERIIAAIPTPTRSFMQLGMTDSDSLLDMLDDHRPKTAHRAIAALKRDPDHHPDVLGLNTSPMGSDLEGLVVNVPDHSDNRLLNSPMGALQGLSSNTDSPAPYPLQNSWHENFPFNLFSSCFAEMGKSNFSVHDGNSTQGSSIEESVGYRKSPHHLKQPGDFPQIPSTVSAKLSSEEFSQTHHTPQLGRFADLPNRGPSQTYHSPLTHHPPQTRNPPLYTVPESSDDPSPSGRHNGNRPNYARYERVSHELLPDPADFGWKFTGSCGRTEYFERKFDGCTVEMDFYFTTGRVQTIMVNGSNPRVGEPYAIIPLFGHSGKTKNGKCSPNLYRLILLDPRGHTDELLSNYDL